MSGAETNPQTTQRRRGKRVGNLRLGRARRSVSLQRSALVTGVLATLMTAVGCSGSVPYAPVTAAQKAALTRYYLTRLWIADGYARVGCPVAVLGAASIGRRLRVYTVVHCTAVTSQCVDGTEYTEGLVADLIEAEVIAVKRDDAPDYAGMIAESNIYPSALRSAALDDINSGGPAWLRELAAKAAGCAHGVHS